jgi:hypothetical protein
MLTRLLKQPFWILCGLSVTLTSCATGEVGVGTRPTRFLSVQPIQVCNDLGVFCADLALFEAETKKLWDQADIQVDFLAPVRLNGTRFLTIDSEEEFAELSFSAGQGPLGDILSPPAPLAPSTCGLSIAFLMACLKALVGPG